MTQIAIIKVGTKVRYRGCFGMDNPTEVTIEGIYRSDYKRDKEGYPVYYIPFCLREYATFSLSNGHWCYGEQIDAIVNER